MKKHFIAIIMSALLAAVLLAGCGDGDRDVSAVSGAEVSDFGRRTCFVTCAQKHEKAFMHYDN